MSIYSNFFLLFLLNNFRQVFKEASTYRSKMRTYCRSIFEHHYSWALGRDDTELFEGQLSRQRVIADRVGALIGDGSSTFHFGPNDTQVSFLFHFLFYSSLFFPGTQEQPYASLR
jgi:hypothetical protein